MSDFLSIYRNAFVNPIGTSKINKEKILDLIAKRDFTISIKRLRSFIQINSEYRKEFSDDDLWQTYLENYYPLYASYVEDETFSSIVLDFIKSAASVLAHDRFVTRDDPIVKFTKPFGSYYNMCMFFDTIHTDARVGNLTGQPAITKQFAPRTTVIVDSTYVWAVARSRSYFEINRITQRDGSMANFKLPYVSASDEEEVYINEYLHKTQITQVANVIFFLASGIWVVFDENDIYKQFDLGFVPTILETTFAPESLLLYANGVNVDEAILFLITVDNGEPNVEKKMTPGWFKMVTPAGDTREREENEMPVVYKYGSKPYKESDVLHALKELSPLPSMNDYTGISPLQHTLTLQTMAGIPLHYNLRDNSVMYYCVTPLNVVVVYLVGKIPTVEIHERYTDDVKLSPFNTKLSFRLLKDAGVDISRCVVCKAADANYKCERCNFRLCNEACHAKHK